MGIADGTDDTFDDNEDRPGQEDAGGLSELEFQPRGTTKARAMLLSRVEAGLNVYCVCHCKMRSFCGAVTVQKLAGGEVSWLGTEAKGEEQGCCWRSEVSWHCLIRFISANRSVPNGEKGTIADRTSYLGTAREGVATLDSY